MQVSRTCGCLSRVSFNKLLVSLFTSPDGNNNTFWITSPLGPNDLPKQTQVLSLIRFVIVMATGSEDVFCFVNVVT